MRFFYISTQADKNNMFEIHERECAYLPSLEDREYIGLFKNSKEALKKAIHAHPNASLCAHCCNL